MRINRLKLIELYKKNYLSFWVNVVIEQILINGNKMSTMIGLCWANDYKQLNPFLYKEIIQHHLTI